MDNVTTVSHPLVQHKLTLMRDKTTSTNGFRQLLREIATLLCYEVTRDLSLETIRDRDAADADAGRKCCRARSWCLRRSCAPAWDSSKACWTWCPRRGSRISGFIATRSR